MLPAKDRWHQCRCTEADRRNGTETRESRQRWLAGETPERLQQKRNHVGHDERDYIGHRGIAHEPVKHQPRHRQMYASNDCAHNGETKNSRHDLKSDKRSGKPGDRFAGSHCHWHLSKLPIITGFRRIRRNVVDRRGQPPIPVSTIHTKQSKPREVEMAVPRIRSQRDASCSRSVASGIQTRVSGDDDPGSPPAGSTQSNEARSSERN